MYHLPNALQGEGWNLVDLNVPAQADGGGSWLSLRTEIRDGLADFRSAGFIPHHVLGNGDYRQLGALVGAIRIIS